MAHQEPREFEEFGEFAPGLRAGLGGLRQRRADERRNLARATSRVRTSGVRFIPQRTLEAGAESRELGLIGQVGLQSALERIKDRRLQQQQRFQTLFAREGFARRSGLARDIAKRQLTGQIIGGFLGGAGAALGG